MIISKGLEKPRAQTFSNQLITDDSLSYYIFSS